MYENELAKIIINTIEMLTYIFQSNVITLEEYISNVDLKLRYLNSYLKETNDTIEKDIIMNIIHKVEKITDSNFTACSTQL